MADEFEISTGDSPVNEAPEVNAESSSSTDTGEDQKSASNQGYDAQELAELRRLNAELQERIQRGDAERGQFKEELAKLRDDQRQRDLLLVGDKDALAARQEQLRQQKIKDEFFKIFPEVKNALDRGQSAQPNVAEAAYLNSAKSKGFELADKMGFKETSGKEFMIYAADMLIQNTPQWKQRFYQAGDMNVLDEVADFINKKVFEPRDRMMKQQWINSLKKQNQFSTPLPRGGAGSPKTSGVPEKIDASKAEDRMKVFAHIYNRATQGAETEL